MDDDEEWHDYAISTLESSRVGFIVTICGNRSPTGRFDLPQINAICYSLSIYAAMKAEDSNQGLPFS